jgi:flavin-binding protein dodecin
MGKTYKMLEIVGTSPKSFAEATRNAVEQAGKSIQAMGWFEVERLGGRIENGKVSEYQAKINVGFRLLSPEELKK